jgi:hypothetical protein
MATLRGASLQNLLPRGSAVTVLDAQEIRIAGPDAFRLQIFGIGLVNHFARRDRSEASC